MINSIVLISSLLVAALAAPMNDTRILGGNYANDGQFPYLISLRQRAANFHLCGGSILNEYWILTAAHCVVGQNAAGLVVVTGTNYISSGGTAYRVERYTYHQSYDAKNIINDVAVIKIYGPIQYNAKVKPVQLYTGYVQARAVVTLPGWGQTSHPGQGSDRLKYLNFQTIDTDTCAYQLYPNFVNDLELCVVSQYGSGACMGDSGGPLTWNGYQVGITSWVIPCGLGKPDVFVRVSQFYSWITANMR